jgi:streptogramin lyase
MSFSIKSNKFYSIPYGYCEVPSGFADTKVITNLQNNTSWSYVPNSFRGSNLFPENTIDTNSIIVDPSAGGWSGGCLAPNGNIYLIPRTTNTPVAILNPFTNTLDLSAIPNPGLVDSAYVGGVLGRNGNIYCAPYNTSSIMVINTFSNTLSYIDVSSTTASARWVGGCLAPNGNIFFAPYNDNNILRVNPGSNDISYIDISGLTTAVISRFQGACDASNGSIYFIPDLSPQVIVLNPNTNVASVPAGLANLGLTNKFFSGALAPNGRIYCSPDSSNNIGIINPNNNTFSSINATSLLNPFTFKMQGIVCGTNGQLYCIPRNYTSVIRIDTSSNTISTFGSLSSVSKYVGGVLGPNNIIYAIPLNGGNIGIIKTGFPAKYQPWMLAPEFNKL